MPKAYLTRATVERIASEAAYLDFPDATGNGMTSADDIGWINRFNEVKLELVETYRDGLAVTPGGWPTMGVVGLRNGMAYMVDGKDWYVDQLAAGIAKADAGILPFLQGK